MYLTLNEWNKNHPKNSQHTEEDILGDIFAYLTEYKGFYLLLKDRGILYFLKDIMRDLFGPKDEYTNLQAYTVAFIKWYLWVD